MVQGRRLVPVNTGHLSSRPLSCIVKEDTQQTGQPSAPSVKMVSSKRLYNWYISLVAAMCMVLYGYDASVFNSVQGSQHWLDWFDLNLVSFSR